MRLKTENKREIKMNELVAEIRAELAKGNLKGLSDFIKRKNPKDYPQVALEYINRHAEAFGMMCIEHRGQWQFRYSEAYERHKMVEAAKISNFVLAGNSTFTLRNKETKARYTYKVRRPRRRVDNPDGEGHKMVLQDYFEVFLLCLPENASITSYQKFGELHLDDELDLEWTRTRNLQAGEAIRGWEWFWGKLEQARVEKRELNFQRLEFWHEGRCGRCGKKLTVPESIADGLGPKCVRYRQDEVGAICAW